MVTGVTAEVRKGFTGHDHLISQTDRDAVRRAVAGQQFPNATAAQKAADAAFQEVCDRRVALARVQVKVRSARGDVITVG